MTLKTLLSFVLVTQLASPLTAAAPRTDWKEVIAPDEAKLFAELPAEFNRMQRNVAADEGATPQRGLHNKSHLAMRGTLTVIDGLPDVYRQGFFKTPGTHQTWVRFSNGQGVRQEDRRPDLRGMAVKVLNAPGDNLSAEKSFDIVLNNFSSQPARNILQFMTFIRAQSNPLTLPIKLAHYLGFGEAKRILSWAAANLGNRVTSLATTDFFTGLPLKYGPYACRIRLRPNNGQAPTSAVTSERDYLRWDLVRRIGVADQRWDVLVQLYTDPQKTRSRTPPWSGRNGTPRT